MGFPALIVDFSEIIGVFLDVVQVYIFAVIFLALRQSPAKFIVSGRESPFLKS